MTLPKIRTYGNYTSNNYGAHCLQVTVGSLTIWFSYQTPVAFESHKTGLVVRANDWGPTTGKHLNAIDGGNKKKRVDSATFEKLFQDKFNLENTCATIGKEIDKAEVT